MDSPNPVPPNLRVVEVSTCMKGCEQGTPVDRRGMPMPVSRTSQRTRVTCRLLSMTLIPRDTSPFSM